MINRFKKWFASNFGLYSSRFIIGYGGITTPSELNILEVPLIIFHKTTLGLRVDILTYDEDGKVKTRSHYIDRLYWPCIPTSLKKFNNKPDIKYFFFNMFDSKDKIFEIEKQNTPMYRIKLDYNNSLLVDYKQIDALEIWFRNKLK